MKSRQRKLTALLCVVLSAMALWGCEQAPEEKTVEDVAIVETAKPELGDLKLSGQYIATISPDESVYVVPKATAEVLEVKVAAGDIVEEGDVLAVLDDTMAQFTVRNAQTAAQNAQTAAQNAQIGLESAKISYELQYGAGASTLNDMQSDKTISQAEDGVSKLQESYVDAMDNLEKAKDQLEEKEQELEDLKVEYDFHEDVDEIKDYADSIDRDTPQGAAQYAAIMQRYQLAATEVKTVEGTIAQYKSTIDQLEGTIEELQDNINSTYDSYSQAVTADNITNGEILEGKKQASQNSISQAELSISQAQIGIAQAQIGVEQAQENLDAYVITATISGMIESVNLKEHDFATSSNPAFVISNKNTMTATYYVSEDVRNTFSLGQKITLEKDNRLYDGEVVEIGSALDNTTGLFKIKATVKGDTSALLSGTKATVTTDTYHEQNAVIIPYDSVYYDGTQAYVYTVVDGKARKTNVSTGLYDIERIVITEGLTKEDTIITTWSAQLRDGVEISLPESEADTDNHTQE